MNCLERNIYSYTAQTYCQQKMNSSMPKSAKTRPLDHITPSPCEVNKTKIKN